MATKTKKPDNATLKQKSGELGIKEEVSEKEKAEKHSKTIISPELAAYRILNGADGETGVWKDVDVLSMINELRAQAAAVSRGDLTHVEAMLMNQATALQTLFARLTERAMTQTQMPNLEGFMRMALRSQAQCRATLETLAAIKNPPVVFAKQANISNGPQQVNNGVALSAHAEKTINQQNELLEVQHGSKTMDTRTASEASCADPAMATVGEIRRG